MGRITPTELLEHTGKQVQQLVTIRASPIYGQNVAARKVFNTVELIELILLHLPPVEQLHSKEVCTGFRDVISGSPCSRATTFMQAAPKSTLSLPPYTIPGFAIRRTQVRGLDGISATFHYHEHWNHYRKILRASKTLRRIFIAQPPPPEVRFWVDCKCNTGSTQKLRRRLGIRFGEIFRAVDATGRRRCRTCNSPLYLRILGLYSD